MAELRGRACPAWSPQEDQVLSTRCRCHKRDQGATLPAGSGRTRWVCGACLTIIREHKLKMGGGRE